MEVILSNAKLTDFANNLDRFINYVAMTDIKEIELCANSDMLDSLEGLHGEKELNLFKNKLKNLGIRLYGFCLYTDFSLHYDIMYAKKCINLLNKLNAKHLRLIIKPMEKNDICDGIYSQIISFINSLSRFASYSAGGGDRESTIRISFDLLNETGLGVEEILKVNSAIQQSRNSGIALDFCNSFESGIYKDVLALVNGHEFLVNHVAIPYNKDEKNLNKKIEQFISESAMAYDGNICIDFTDDALKYNAGTTDTTNIINILIDLVKKYEFNKSIIDYTKVSYPSSVARYFKKFGEAVVTPKNDVTAGDAGTWKLSYVVGGQGIKENGSIKFAFHHSTDWEPFQIDKPSKGGYVSVNLIRNEFYNNNVSVNNTNNNRITLTREIKSIDACRYICLNVKNGDLAEGDKIEITIGDTWGGSKGSIAQTFQQKEFKFFLLVDATGKGIYFEHPNPPVIQILGGEADKIKVIAPSVINIREHFDIRVRVEDKYRNNTVGYNSKLYLKIEDMDNVILDQVLMTIQIGNNDRAVGKFENIKIDKAGLFRFKVEDETGLIGISNYIKCTDDKDEYKVFWGDIHAHLGYMDSIGTVPEFYDYARNISFLNFVCHSEHMDSFSGGRQATFDLQWEIVKDGTRKYHEDGKFVTLMGYENSEIWDANVYFPNDEAPWHIDSYANRLFDFAKKHGAMVIPHMTTYPQRMRGYDWSNYDPEVMPVAEIYSCHGSSEYFGGEYPLKNCEPGGYIVDALNRGHKLGFIASGDGHDCMPGNAMLMENNCISGLVAVYTKELTRKAVFDAIKNRRCYATTNLRILAYFNIDGFISGSEITVEAGKKISINFSFFGTEDIENVDIVCNGEIIYSKQGNGCVLEESFKDMPRKLGHNYYYARMKQKDGGMAWISPIFVNVKDEK